MIFECSGLKTSSEMYSKVSSVLSRSYICEWNDEVHESFKNYVQRCEECMKTLKNLASQTDRLCMDLNSLHLDQEKTEVDLLVREADALCMSARGLL